MPKAWYEKHHRNPIIASLLSLLIFALLLFSSKFPIVVLFLMLILYFIYRTNTTKISVQTPGFEKAYEESENRMSDSEYKQFLIDSGYLRRVNWIICQSDLRMFQR